MASAIGLACRLKWSGEFALSTGGLVLAGYMMGDLASNRCGRGRLLRLQRALLCHAAHLPQRHGASRGIGVDRFDRKSLGHRRPIGKPSPSWPVCDHDKMVAPFVLEGQ